MNSQLVSTFQLFLLVTLIMTAYAGNYNSRKVYDIQSASEFSRAYTYTNSADYGRRTEVSKANCVGAGQQIGKTATTNCPEMPTVHAVKHSSTSEEYVKMLLADCGGGVYVKVLDGIDQFAVYYKE